MKMMIFFSSSHLLNLSDWILSNAIKRYPALSESVFESLITGADSYTPDGRLIMNESAEVGFQYTSSFLQKNLDFV